MKIRSLLLCSLTLGFLSASAVERGYLSVDAAPESVPEVITLADGDMIKFIYVSDIAGVKVTLPNQYIMNIPSYIFGFHTSIPPVAVPEIVGPCTLELYGGGYAAYEITRASEGTSSLPSNSVVIPTDATGDVEIILESSTDLVNWTAAIAGTYGSSTEKRFFRVRAVAQ